jgi:hypothetical protein
MLNHEKAGHHFAEMMMLWMIPFVGWDSGWVRGLLREEGMF